MSDGGDTRGVTPELIAKAIVAAAISFGDDPAKVATATTPTGRRALSAAAGGLALATGLNNSVTADLFGIDRTNVRFARDRAYAPWIKAQEAAREAVAWAVKAQGLVIDAAPRKPGRPARAEDTAPGSGKSKMLPIVRPVLRVTFIPPRPYRPSAVLTTPAGLPVVPVSAMRNVARFGAGRRGASREVVQVKPVTADIRRWGGWFLAAGWDAEEVGDLFGVLAVDLAAA